MATADDDALLPLPPVEETGPIQEGPGPVEKTFRPYDPNHVLLLPPSLDEWRAA